MPTANSCFGRNALLPSSLVALDITICIVMSVKDMAAGMITVILRDIQVLFMLITRYCNLIGTDNILAVQYTRRIFSPPLFSARAIYVRAHNTARNIRARAKYVWLARL